MEPTTEQSMTQLEDFEKITQLEHSLRQQRNLNAQMMRWLDTVEDDFAQPQSENVALKKSQVKTISVALQVETEPFQFLLANDLDVQKICEKNIARLEKESTEMKEQNNKLSAELKNLQLEREWDKINLSKSKFAAQAYEQYMEEARSGLQHMDEVIHQKNVKIKHLEKAVEEYSNMLKELQLTNQELRKQLEEAKDEAILNALNHQSKKEGGLASSPLSFAEEIKLLTSSLEVKTTMSDCKHVTNGQTRDGEHPKNDSHPTDPQNKRCTRILETSLYRAVLVVFCIFIFTVMVLYGLVMTASLGSSRISDFFSFKTLWNSILLMLRPYFSVHYDASPPV